MSATPRLRLLIVSATYAWAEPRKKLVALAAHFELTCITCQRFTSSLGTESEPPDPPTETGVTPLYRLVRLPVLGRPVSTTKYVLRGLGRAVRAHPADLILVESEPWALVRWQTWLAARRHQPRALFGEFSWENVKRPGYKGRVLARAYRAAAATADFVITGNAAAGELFREAGLDVERRLVSPQLGVDETLFRPVTSPTERTARRAEFGQPANGFLIGFAGRLEPEKGLRELVEVVRTVRAMRPESDVRLCLLGSGSLGGEFARVAAAEPWLSVCPPRSHAAMAGFMRALDLFVLPSREVTEGKAVWREQFGHVLIEAMACGVPVLGSDSGAIPEVIREKETVFSWRRPDQLLERLTRFLTDQDRLVLIGVAQRNHTLARYTNSTLARTWAEFLLARHAAGRQKSRAHERGGEGLILGDARILEREHRPRRFLDHFAALDDGALKPSYAFTARDDEDLQQRLRWLRHQRLRVLFNYGLGPWNILAHLFAIRRAGFLYLEGPHYFWLLLLLHRVGLFPARDKIICCLFYRQSRFQRKLALFNGSPDSFRPFFISVEQVRSLEAAGCAPGRLRRVTWRIDADWYRPSATPSRGYILCAGNIHRDEALILALLKAGLPLPLVRAGRLEGLRESYVKIARLQPGTVRLSINLNHHAYLRLVQNAALVLLPIKPCDEPAGLTAALEALACATPLLANDGLEVGNLLRDAGLGAPVPDLQLDTWLRAINGALAPGGRNESALAQARAHIERERAIQPGNQDWRDFITAATL